MATSSSNKQSTQQKKTSTTRKSTSAKSKSNSNQGKTRRISKSEEAHNSAIHNEIMLILIFTIALIFFLCNFGIVGKVGSWLSAIQFGLFGTLAYIAPVAIFLTIAFHLSNTGSFLAKVKLLGAILLFFLLSAMIHIITGHVGEETEYSLVRLYQLCANTKFSGGVIGGSVVYLLYDLFDLVGTILVLLVGMLISAVLITQKSMLRYMKSGGQKVYTSAMKDAEYRKEWLETKKEEQIRSREEAKQKREEKKEQEAVDKMLRMDHKVSGVIMDTTLVAKEEKKPAKNDMHEITLTEDIPTTKTNTVCQSQEEFDFSNVRIHKAKVEPHVETEPKAEEPKVEEHKVESSKVISMSNKVNKKEEMEQEQKSIDDQIHELGNPLPKQYIFPPISRLKKMEASTTDSTRQLRETALQLQQTLQTFGVKVTITDISQGPAVTRYEMQPEAGVKVSKIVGLADDIKLNLAATDIRIEAPIPGKAAVGIEVPNAENAAVGLRELLENKTFKEFPSKLAFAVGKDISGSIVVSDIAKMPHMLIAGATGSGKSVCINTLIMSILYKAHPDDVKLIMIDPKVVELSVYNGIPHLLIPVVTDCKKAAAALHWGVAEMTDRYTKFADFNVRDLAGYNKQVEKMQADGNPDAPKKMPQIVIIVDELADLMMVAPGEVEEAICRLAQLARAAGIHLIIATQRPSVDVITGLIKANMPSRVAFSVSSGIDSRTILDMNGAEKLLGKGDMLFYPQGYPKPVRVQGAFVSDGEVHDVVEFLKNQAIGNVYSEEIENSINSIGTSGAQGGLMSDGGSEKDAYFVEAGQFIIEKEKASIGMLQRVFKIGFNRAARIMDQLAEAGVVGEEEGTKPRKVLMSMEQFESYIEEYL